MAHVYYRDEPEVVEFIEIFAATEVNLRLFGLDPFSALTVELADELEAKFPGLQEDDCWIFPGLAVSLW